ncbi:MAG: DUF167 domain-containing protein [Luteolibacter sp.]
MKLHIKATPNARKSEVIGWETDPIRGRVLRVRIAAPPAEGKANAALRTFLANWLDLPKSKVILEKGDTSRVKTFTIPDDHPLP